MKLLKRKLIITIDIDDIILNKRRRQPRYIPHDNMSIYQSGFKDTTVLNCDPLKIHLSLYKDGLTIFSKGSGE